MTDRLGSDDGAVTVYVLIIMAFVLVGSMGLLIDGSARIESIGQARDIADNAARSAGQSHDPFTGEVDQARAHQAATQYLAGTNATLVSVTYPTAADVEVVVQITVDYHFIPGTGTVSGYGYATSETG